MSDLAFFTELLQLASAANGRFLIGIVGPPAAGKSTLARLLKKEMELHFPGQVATLAMDAYHLPNQVLHDRGLYPWKGCHFTFDAVEFVTVVGRVKKASVSISIPVYDRGKYHDPIPDQDVIMPQHRFIIVEGNYLLLQVAPWNTINALLDFSISIQVDSEIQLSRLIDRHMVAGRSRAEATEKAHSTDLPNTKLIATHSISASALFRPPENFL